MIEKKPAQIHFHSRRQHTITKMNDNINMDPTRPHTITKMNDNINMDPTRPHTITKMDPTTALSINAHNKLTTS
jgi:hypothetical protein